MKIFPVLPTGVGTRLRIGQKREWGGVYSEFNFDIRFDWDSSTGPWSKDIAEVLSAMSFILTIDEVGRFRTELFNLEECKDKWSKFGDTMRAEKCYEIASSMDGFFEE